MKLLIALVIVNEISPFLDAGRTEVVKSRKSRWLKLIKRDYTANALIPAARRLEELASATKPEAIAFR